MKTHFIWRMTKMCRNFQIVILVVVCSLNAQIVNAEVIVLNETNTIKNEEGLRKQGNPLVSLLGGLGLIGIGMWVNHKNKV